MTKVQLDPNGTTSNTGSLTFGGATAHQTLNDGSDSTFIMYDYNEQSVLTLDDLTLPSGAALWYARVRMKVLKAQSGASGKIYTEVGGGGGQTDTITWLTPFVEMTGDTDSLPTDAEVDAASLTLKCTSDPIDVWVSQAWVEVYYWVKPAVSVTAPTGTITSNQPTVTWTQTKDADDTAATVSWEVKIFNAAQYGAGGFDPDTSTPYSTSVGTLDGTSQTWASSDSWTVPGSLPDDDYRAYVRMWTDTTGSGFASDWDYEAFTVDADRPGEPVVGLTADNANGRVQIQLADTPGEGSASADIWNIERSWLRDYDAAVVALGPSLYLPLAGDAPLTDQSGNGYNGTGGGSITEGGYEPGPPLAASGTVNDGTDFDGTDDRVTTTYTTRRQLLDNPRCDSSGVDCVTVYGGGASYDSYGFVAGVPNPVNAPRVYEAVSNTNDRGPLWRNDLGSSVLELGATYTGGAWAKGPAGASGTVTPQEYTTAGAWQQTGTSASFTFTGDWQWVESNPMTMATADARFYMSVRLIGATGTVQTVGGLLEEGSGLSGYTFDGEGYCDASNEWVNDPGGHTGWLGTAHNSMSDLGCFANGTTRTFAGWVYRDNQDDYHTLVSSSIQADAAIRFNLSADTLQLYPDGSTGYALTSSGIGTGEWHHWAVVFDEVNDTRAFYIDGVLASESAATAQWAGPDPTGLMIGRRATVRPMDGKMRGVGVWERGLTDTEIATIYDGGREWEFVRCPNRSGTIHFLLSATEQSVWDYEAPNGTYSVWRAAAGDLSELTQSGWTYAAGLWTSSDYWVKHPTLPSENLKVKLRSYGSWNVEANQGTFRPLGSPTPVVVSDVRGPTTGQVTFRLDSAAERAALTRLLNLNQTCLLQVPSGDEIDDRWVVLTAQATQRILDHGKLPYSDEQIDWVEVVRPDDELAE